MMTNQTKLVTLPKEVADALDELRSLGMPSFFIAQNVGVKQGLGASGLNPMLQIVDAWRTEDEDSRNVLLMGALVNGYEVEMTPEEKVAEYYESLFDANQFDKKEYVLVKTLNLLGINIPGVNVR